MGFAFATCDFLRERRLQSVLIGGIEPAPVRKGAVVKRSLGGPRAQVNGKSDAVARVSAENNPVIALPVMSEDRRPALAKQNWASPPVREASRRKRRMQTAHAAFERREHPRWFGSGDIQIHQVAGLRRTEETCTPDYRIVGAETPPKIR